MELTTQDKKALEELFIRGTKVLGVPADLTPETLGKILEAGLEDQREFVTEMLEGRTERSKIANEVLSTEVYIRANAIASRESMFRKLDNMADGNYRKAWGLA